MIRKPFTGGVAGHLLLRPCDRKASAKAMQLITKLLQYDERVTFATGEGLTA